MRLYILILFVLFSFSLQGQHMLLAGGGEEAAPPAGLLLDDYPGAAAAYSLRELSTSWSGLAVIRVRESGGNTEQDFTAAEITDGNLSTFCGANNGFVVTWYDQSGQGNDATQSTLASQAKIYDGTTGLVYENGKVALDFDGIDDFLLAGGIGLTSLSDFFTVQVVTGTTYTINKASIAISDNTSNPTGNSFFTLYPFDASPYSGPGVRGYFNGNIILDENSATRSGQILFTYDQPSAVSRSLYVDGFSVISNTLSKTINTASHIHIGANDVGQYFGEKIQETIFYSSSQSANRTGIESDINTYYSIY